MSAAPDWKLDPASNEYYYFSNQENAYVFQSGRRIPLTHPSAQPALGSPPAPPPKPSGQNSSGINTPLAGPPRPPPHPNAAGQDGGQNGLGDLASVGAAMAQIPPPEAGWLPEVLKDKNTIDLHKVVANQSLQQAFVNSSTTAHPSLKTSTSHLQSVLANNLSLATQLAELESQLRSSRSHTQTRLLSLRALERQFYAKQSEQDAALRDFSPRGLFQRLAAAVSDQEQLCRGLEESFLEEQGGPASEREVGEFVRRVKEARRVAYLRRERKERWDEGRIGGLRG